MTTIKSYEGYLNEGILNWNFKFKSPIQDIIKYFSNIDNLKKLSIYKTIDAAVTKNPQLYLEIPNDATIDSVVSTAIPNLDIVKGELMKESLNEGIFSFVSKFLNKDNGTHPPNAVVSIGYIGKFMKKYGGWGTLISLIGSQILPMTKDFFNDPAANNLINAIFDVTKYTGAPLMAIWLIGFGLAVVCTYILRIRKNKEQRGL